MRLVLGLIAAVVLRSEVHTAAYIHDRRIRNVARIRRLAMAYSSARKTVGVWALAAVLSVRCLRWPSSAPSLSQVLPQLERQQAAKLGEPRFRRAEGCT